MKYSLTFTRILELPNTDTKESNILAGISGALWGTLRRWHMPHVAYHLSPVTSDMTGALREHLKEVPGGPLGDQNKVFIFTPLPMHSTFEGRDFEKSLILFFFKWSKTLVF